MLGALVGGVGDLLAEAGDFDGERANQRGAGFEVVEDVLDGVAVGGGGGFDGDGVAFRVGAGLDPEGFGVVVAGDRAFGAGEDEAALGLGLMGPGVGEGAPAGFGFAETEGVAEDGDGVFIDFEAVGDVPGAGDFQGGAAVEMPGTESGAVAHVVEEGATALRGAVEPTGGFFGRGGFGVDFIGAVVERASIAAVVVEAGDFADEAFLDEAVGGLLAGDPDEGPVDDELFAGGSHGGDHGVGFGEGGGEGFFHEDVDAMGGDLLDPVAVSGGGGTEDDEVGLGLFEAGVGVGEDLGVAEAEVLLGAGHARGVLVTDGDDVGAGVIEDLAEQVAHVKVVEVDACDAPLFHWLRFAVLCWRIG